MKNVEVQCVLELASKVSAWGLQMQIIRFMQYRDKVWPLTHLYSFREWTTKVYQKDHKNVAWSFVYYPIKLAAMMVAAQKHFYG